MTPPHQFTDTARQGTLDWLESLGPDGACTIIERAIAQAVDDRDLDAVPDLLQLMCRFDPHRAERVRRVMIDATEGLITITLDLSEPQ